jgi:hypothetical protein
MHRGEERVLSAASRDGAEACKASSLLATLSCKLGTKSCPFSRPKTMLEAIMEEFEFNFNFSEEEPTWAGLNSEVSEELMLHEKSPNLRLERSSRGVDLIWGESCTTLCAKETCLAANGLLLRRSTHYQEASSSRCQLFHSLIQSPPPIPPNMKVHIKVSRSDSVEISNHETNMMRGHQETKMTISEASDMKTSKGTSQDGVKS